MEHYILKFSQFGGTSHEICLYGIDEVIGALRAIEFYRLNELELKLYLPEE